MVYIFLKKYVESTFVFLLSIGERSYFNAFVQKFVPRAQVSNMVSNMVPRHDNEVVQLCAPIYTRARTHAHTHTHIYIYVS
jgi:hypothetical protein